MRRGFASDLVFAAAKRALAGWGRAGSAQIDGAAGSGAADDTDNDE